MYPEPTRYRKEENEKEIVVSCEFIESKMIAGAMARKYPEYVFWNVDDSHGKSGLYIESSLDRKIFYQVVGYAMAMLDVLRGMKG